MRIAVASEGLDVSSHFGCCTNFNFYQVENGELVDSRNLPAKGTFADRKQISCDR